MKRKRAAIIIIGAIFGILFSFSAGSFFILVLSFLSIQIIKQVSTRPEQPFLLSVFIGGLALRVILVVLAISIAAFSGRILNYSPQGCPDYSALYILDDDGYYTLRAWFTSMQWSGEPMNTFAEKAIVKNTYGFSGFIYVLALFFKAFGYSPVSSRFINCLLGAWTGILVYFTLKHIFNERSARLACALASFFPSLVLWSITNLKEPPMIFAVCLMLFFLAGFQRTGKIYYLGLTLASILSAGFIRSYSYGREFVIIACVIAGLYGFYLYIHRLPPKKKAAILILLFFAACLFVFLGREKITAGLGGISQKMILRHAAIILSEKGRCYRLLPYEYYAFPGDLNFGLALKVFIKGWFHLMFEPLPWRIQSVSMMAAFPQMLLWYLLIPFAVLGVAVLIKHRMRESAALIVYFFIIASILAVTEGNIGTVFRHRDINTPFFLMFASVGLIYAFYGFKDDKISGR